MCSGEAAEDGCSSPCFTSMGMAVKASVVVLLPAGPRLSAAAVVSESLLASLSTVGEMLSVVREVGSNCCNENLMCESTLMYMHV